MVAELWFKALGGNVEKAPSSNEEPGDPWECHLLSTLGFNAKNLANSKGFYVSEKLLLVSKILAGNCQRDR